jgi:hypothetical protein
LAGDWGGVKITHVAIRQGGSVRALPSPWRHHHLILLISYDTGSAVDGEQGFLVDGERFVTRQEALAIALASGQVKDPEAVRAGRLFSEDLW